MRIAAERKMPVLFIGHGNPLHAIVDGPYSASWSALGLSLPEPQAILVISAHWYIDGTRVTAMAAPRTIHDFGGFPAELYQVEYPAPGDPVLAQKVINLLAQTKVEPDQSWGLDHGAWAVLRHLFPAANLPVVQLSLDRRLSADEHFQLGAALRPLREQGVLIIGSGNIVHNLAGYSWQDLAAPPPAWATEFETRIRKGLNTRDAEALIHYHQIGRPAELAVPTPEHFLPLLYIAALGDADEVAAYPVDGFDGGTMSMLSVQFG